MERQHQEGGRPGNAKDAGDGCLISFSQGEFDQ
jgi:hypothetical protein